jgi:hypothetical protein
MAQAVIQYRNPQTGTVWYSIPMSPHDALIEFTRSRQRQDPEQFAVGAFPEGTLEFEEGKTRWERTREEGTGSWLKISSRQED